jgi:hypothetical protein
LPAIYLRAAVHPDISLEHGSNPKSRYNDVWSREVIPIVGRCSVPKSNIEFIRIEHSHCPSDKINALVVGGKIARGVFLSVKLFLDLVTA